MADSDDDPMAHFDEDAVSRAQAMNLEVYEVYSFDDEVYEWEIVAPMEFRFRAVVREGEMTGLNITLEPSPDNTRKIRIRNLTSPELVRGWIDLLASGKPIERTDLIREVWRRF